MESHEHVEGVRATARFVMIPRHTILVLVLCALRGGNSFIYDHCVISVCRGLDATRVENCFPSRDDFIFQYLSAKMVKYSTSVDGVEEDGRGPLRISKPEWRTRRGCTEIAE